MRLDVCKVARLVHPRPHHTDAEREWAYDRKSQVGKLDKALDEGQAKDWTIVDMKRDWKVVYPFQK